MALSDTDLKYSLLTEAAKKLSGAICLEVDFETREQALTVLDWLNAYCHKINQSKIRVVKEDD